MEADFLKTLLPDELPLAWLAAFMLAWEMSLETAVKRMTLFPTATVRMCEPSSLETQSSMTLCFGETEEGALPILLMYFFTPSKVERLGTETKPKFEGRNGELI